MVSARVKFLLSQNDEAEVYLANGDETEITGVGASAAFDLNGTHNPVQGNILLIIQIHVECPARDLNPKRRSMMRVIRRKSR